MYILFLLVLTAAVISAGVALFAGPPRWWLSLLSIEQPGHHQHKAKRGE
jgi:hypothetical protein